MRNKESIKSNYLQKEINTQHELNNTLTFQFIPHPTLDFYSPRPVVSKTGSKISFWSFVVGPCTRRSLLVCLSPRVRLN